MERHALPVGSRPDHPAHAAAAHNLEIEIDLVDHRLSARTTQSEAGFELHDGLSVADFYSQYTDVLERTRCEVASRPSRSAFPSRRRSPKTTSTQATTPTRSPAFSTSCNGAPTRSRSSPAGIAARAVPCTCSGTASTSPSAGSPASESNRDAGIDPVNAEAYSHEVISFGFWAGDQNMPFPAYYSYTAPEPAELTQQKLRPPQAEWTPLGNGSLAILRYDDVRSAADPKATLHEFLQSAFEAGASLAGWDLVDTATGWCPVPADRLSRLSRIPSRRTRRG